MQDSQNCVIIISCKIGGSGELSIHNWIKFEIIVIWLNTCDKAICSNELEHKQEAAALLIDTGRLASGEDQQVVTADGGVLDVEVFDVYIQLLQPFPFISRSQVCIMGHADLEAVISEVDLGKDSQRLFIIVLYIQLVCHNVILWESSWFIPWVCLQVVSVALFLLISTQEENVCDTAVLSLNWHARTGKLNNLVGVTNFWRGSACKSFLLARGQVAEDTSTKMDGWLEREEQESVSAEDNDKLRDDLFVFSNFGSFLNMDIRVVEVWLVEHVKIQYSLQSSQAFVFDDILAIMSPLVIIKFNLFAVYTIWELQCPQRILFDQQMEFGSDGWINASIFHDLWYEDVVK